MGTIFISYRRADAVGDAGRLYDRLSAHFGADRVFRDLDTIRPGRRFAREIDASLARCDAMVALIGPMWAGEGDPPRIAEPDDYVRMELAAALRSGIPVVPVLLRNTSMPRSDRLPPDLEGLTAFQAMEVDSDDFHDDVDRLIQALEGVVEPAGRRRLRRPAAFAGIGLAIALALGALVVARLGGPPGVELRSQPATLTGDEVRALIVSRGYWSAASNPGAEPRETTYSVRETGGVLVVEDAASGLVWERGGSGDVVQGGRAGALDRVAELNRRGYAGYRDWRLPTLDEALSLMTPDVTAGFHLDPAFEAMGAPFAWTIDTGPDGRGYVVYYHQRDGYASLEVEGFNAYVRAVRGP